MRRTLLAVLFGGCLIGSAKADWEVIGAAWSCDGKQNSFSLVEATDASDDALAVRPPEGFERLAEGKSRLSCKLSSAKVEAIVRVHPPAARGMGMGSGYVSVDKMEVDGLPVLGYPTAFNWAIAGSPKALTKIAVSTQANTPIVEICNTEKCHQVSLAANSLLNRTYQEVMRALPEPDRQQLRQEQRVWLKDRDPQCRTAVVGKQHEPLAFLQCVLSATEVRTIRLGEMQRPR
jgi:uncharacterized protein YecT (DUF1311 family)